MEIIRQTEIQYKALEDKVYHEYECPDKQYQIHLTLVKREEIDPESKFLHPIADPASGQSFFYQGSHEEGKKLMEPGRTFKGKIVTTQGEEEAEFIIRPSGRLMEAAKNLYRLYQENNIGWTTLNIAYLHKMFDILPQTENMSTIKAIQHHTVDLEEFASKAHWNVLPVWNVCQEAVMSSNFMVPCKNEPAWEHRIGLQAYGLEYVYLFYRQPQLLSYKREGDDLIVRTATQELPQLTAVKIAAPRPLKEAYTRWPLFGNGKKDSFTRRYLSHTGVELQTEADLARKIHELDLCGMLRYLDSQIVAEVAPPYQCYQMNPFEEAGLFDAAKRRVLLLRFEKKKGRAGSSRT